MDYALKVKNTLLYIMKQMEQDTSPFVKNPGKDFSRNRKLSFFQILLLILTMEGASIRQELFHFFDYSPVTPSASAFIQQREKITRKAFYHILYSLNDRFPGSRTFHGYSLLACDGSVFTLPNNLNTKHPEQFTYHRHSSQDDYYQMHLNMLYDLLNRRYLDIIVNPRRKNQERECFLEMLRRGNFGKKTIFIADRGYEGFGILTHIHSAGLRYIIRAKDSSTGGIVKGFHLPKQGEYDVEFTRLFTCRNNRMVRENPDLYYRMHRSRSVSSLIAENPYLEMTIRVLRIEVAKGVYECILTNLPKEQFPREWIREIYHLRWGIETSFRDLKYQASIRELHSRTPELIVQEILAGLIIYNFCQIITMHSFTIKKGSKYLYQTNFRTAMYLCLGFIRDKWGKSPPDIAALIEKELLPVRPGRSFRRKNRYAHPINFLYRAL